jgi:hypothetical protein
MGKTAESRRDALRVCRLSVSSKLILRHMWLPLSADGSVSWIFSGPLPLHQAEQVNNSHFCHQSTQSRFDLKTTRAYVPPTPREAVILASHGFPHTTPQWPTTPGSPKSRPRLAHAHLQMLCRVAQHIPQAVKRRTARVPPTSMRCAVSVRNTI